MAVNCPQGVSPIALGLSSRESSISGGPSRLPVFSRQRASTPSWKPLVIAAKGKRGNMPYGRKGSMQQQMPSMPEIDPNDDTPRFVLFIKTKAVNRWYPLSVVTGGTTAKFMVGAMKNELGKGLYEGALTRNIGEVLYKDEKALVQSAVRQYPMLKGASGYEYGYKIMDNKNPRSSVYGTDVCKIPPQDELKSPLDKAKDFVGDKLGGLGLEGLKNPLASLLPAQGDQKKAEGKETQA